MKFVVAPDSFKESLTAAEAARVMAEAIRSVVPDAVVREIPMADGGEGTTEAFVNAARGRSEETKLTGPLGSPVVCRFGLVREEGRPEADRDVGVLDAASVFGLAMVPAERRDPYRTTSRGMGEWLVRLLDQGVRRFVVGLGGSATNDGGIGLLSALGAKFKDSSGNVLFGYGVDLLRVEQADFGELDERLAECEITIAGDVSNPLCGPNGASAVYGPQKGADPEQVKALDIALSHYADLVEEATGLRNRDRAGAGAAGGVGFALLTLGAKMVPGAEAIAQAAGLAESLADADYALTGEGRSDAQTLNGKLPYYVAKYAKDAGVKAILISGSLGETTDGLDDLFAAYFSCTPRPQSLRECVEQAETNLYACTRNVVRLLTANN